MRILKQSTAYNLAVFITDSADHISGKTGLTLTIAASKDGAAFASITPTVTELSSGWYKLALTSSHTDTLGDLALHITATGADPTDVAMVVRANVLGDTLPANIISAAGTAWASGAVTAASLATDAGDEIAAAVFARAFSSAYGSYTFDQMVKLFAAVLLGKASGLGTTTATYRNLNDSADVIVATVDADGNRSAVTKTP